MKQKKYVVLVGALLAQVTIAGLYAWSIFGTAIEDEKGWSSDEILLTYSIAQFVFAFSTILSGKLVDTKGPRFTITIGGLLYGGGLILSSFATSPMMLYLTFGVIVGAGVGFVYVCPIATLVKWFPERKGTITGLAVAVFGGGSIIFKEVNGWLIEGSDVSTAFLQLGFLTAAIIVLGAQLTSNPPGYTKVAATKGAGDFTPQEMVKTRTFRMTWVMYWLAVIPGLPYASRVGESEELRAGIRRWLTELIRIHSENIVTVRHRLCFAVRNKSGEPVNGVRVAVHLVRG